MALNNSPDSIDKISSIVKDIRMVIDYLTSNTAGMSDATKKNYRNAIGNFFNYLSNHNENVPNSGNGYIYHLNLAN
jgi:integrase/recombinase XerD